MRSQPELAAAAPGPGVLLPHWHCDSEFGPGVGGSDSGRAGPMVWGSKLERLKSTAELPPGRMVLLLTMAWVTCMGGCRYGPS